MAVDSQSWLLARANVIAYKNLIPGDTRADWDTPSGLRMGTIEVTRLDMREPVMEPIGEFIARVLVNRDAPEDVVKDVIEFRSQYQTLYYNFDRGIPA